MESTHDKLGLSIQEAAHLLGLGRNKFLDLIHAGKVRYVRVGRRIIVPRQALEDFLDSESMGNTG